MPIGATIGAAVVGAGASIYSSSQAGHAQTSAANTASNDQLLVANENNQLARDMYNANASRLDPYSTMGLAAGDQYLGLLLGDAPRPGQPAGNGWAPVLGNPGPNGTPANPTPNGTGTTPGAGGTPTPAPYTGPTLDQINAMQHDGIPGNYQSALAAYYAAHPPTATQALAMQHDGIPGNYAAAMQAINNQPVTPLTGLGGLTPGPGSALAPVVAQQAQQAIAAGADPAAVAARAASYGVRL
jgi:hypothetical protein